MIVGNGAEEDDTIVNAEIDCQLFKLFVVFDVLRHARVVAAGNDKDILFFFLVS